MDASNVQSNATPANDTASHDEPYRFGRRPTVRAPFPFTDRQFARLLIMRGRVQAVQADQELAA